MTNVSSKEFVGMFYLKELKKSEIIKPLNYNHDNINIKFEESVQILFKFTCLHFKKGFLVYNIATSIHCTCIVIHTLISPGN